jgi:molybdate transport system permease protein
VEVSLPLLTPEEWEVLVLSLRVGIVCVLISLPPGVLLGHLLARKQFRGKLLLDGLCHLPLVLPPVVTGYLLLVLLGRRGVLGGFLERTFGIHLAFTWKGAVLASAVVGFPLMLRAIRLAIEGVDPRLERVARTLGAGPLRAFLTVTLRLSLPGLLVGSLLTFARSLGEFGATITFAANIAGESRTIPVAIFTYMNQPGGDVAAVRLVAISIAVSLGTLVLSEWLARRARVG